VIKTIINIFLRMLIYFIKNLVSFVEDWTVKIFWFLTFSVLFVTKVILIKNLTFFI